MITTSLPRFLSLALYAIPIPPRLSSSRIAYSPKVLDVTGSAVADGSGFFSAKAARTTARSSDPEHCAR